MNIIFDIDGTIISKDDILRPDVKEVFQYLKTKKHKVYLWSAGGIDYADKVANSHNLTSLLVGILPKGLKLNIEPDIVVDDNIDLINYYNEKGTFSIKVPFYEPAIGDSYPVMLSVLGHICLQPIIQKRYINHQK